MLHILSIALAPSLALAQDSSPVRQVAVQSLALMDVGPWGAAALPVGMSPLPSDLWRGADSGTLAAVLARISTDQRFPSMQALSRRAIFSGGLAPSSDPDLARLRFEAASRLGPAEAAARLIFGVPRLASDAGLANVAVDAALRVGRVEEACGLIEAVMVPPQGTIWLETRATCYALNNEPDAANLSVDLAKSRGLTDNWLSRAIAGVSGPVSNPPPFRFDSGRALALSLRTKLAPPTNLATMTDPSILSALSQNSQFMSTLSVAEQQAILKNGMTRGAIGVDSIASPYSVVDPANIPSTATPATPTAVSDPAAPAPIMPLPPSASSQIAKAILAATSVAMRSMEARLGIEAIKKQLLLQPGRLDATEVPIIVEAALWAGDGGLASIVAGLSSQALDPRLSLVLALYDPTKQNQAVEQRIDSVSADPVAKRLAMRDAVMAWSAGLPVGGGAFYLVQSGLPWGAGSNGGLRAALNLASMRGSKGEVALLAALATQGVEPINMDGETAVVAIAALSKVGLGDAARDLARDFILASYVTLAPVRPRPRASVTPPRNQPIVPATTQTAKPAALAPSAISATTPARRPELPPVVAPIPAPASRPQPKAKPSWGAP